MTDDPVGHVARAAAESLASPRYATLVEDVEAALHHRDGAVRPDRYVDPAQWGEFIVGVANLAVAAYTTLRRQTPDPSQELIARHVRLDLLRSAAPTTAALDPDELDRIIGVTVEETRTAAKRLEGGA
ncbi:hypothetical protein [Streptomyces sp. NBC_01190]|uniref:hypothetical protein n=1 Tax=Streptomyces sp. NBC_01190 TaxID=2903767 RepID=UPI003868C77D|nr:hypothetical protein OG519_08845 [Streptomyces sp. NBC_01190]